MQRDMFTTWDESERVRLRTLTIKPVLVSAICQAITVMEGFEA